MSQENKHSHEDDVKSSPEDLTEEELDAADNAIGELEKEMDEAQAEQEKLRDQLIRMHAQIENIKRRAEKDVSSAHKYAAEKFVRELLPVVDSLEQALETGLDVASDDSAKHMQEGIELTMKMLLSALEKMGVKQMNPLHEPFDPIHHEAMTMAPTNDHAPNTIVTVVQKGYLMHDRVVRPARVVVAKEV